MIATPIEYEKAQEELRSLEERLAQLQRRIPLGRKDSPRPEFAK